MDLQDIWNIIAMILFSIQASMIQELRKTVREQGQQIDGLIAIDQEK